MSDLATILDLQGRHDDALSLIQRAVDLSRSAGHPDQHVLLGNLAGILLHAGEFGQRATPPPPPPSPPLASAQPPPFNPQGASRSRFGSTKRLWVWLGSPGTRRLWTRFRRG